MSELPKTFDPAEIEARWYAHWEEHGLFRPERPEAEPWTIVNPPPNVTGSLHIGHALDNTLQDILVRRERMRGKDALWVVGTDHAGIATQMVVERRLMEQQKKRTDFSREEFVAKVWEWKEESGGTITRQLRRLGCSMDWENERFTMDEGFTRAVTKVFVDLYNEGLIYRDKRLVNWDPGLRTAISDLEVENTEVQGKFWHFRYPLEDGSGSISVATTRPETMLADMAVAVHPGDERYKDIVGKQVRLPITGRLVPVIADEHADPELGSGAVKITPGHDFNDFEVGLRAGFVPSHNDKWGYDKPLMLNMLDSEARVKQTVDNLIPEDFFPEEDPDGNPLGMDRFEARKQVVAMIEAEGCLEGVEDRVIVTPYGDRSNAVIEPWLTDQWYVDAEKLAQRPMEAVRNGDIKIVPKSWEKTFFNWMENIQPWCVSRQLWWGHRIPAWLGYEFEEVTQNSSRISGTVAFVGATEKEALEAARRHYLKYSVISDNFEPDNVVVVDDEDAASDAFWDDLKVPIWRDPDVLDTWFSSALWPFATLGWPDDAVENSPSSSEEGSGVVTERAAASVTGATDSTTPGPSSEEEGRTRAKPGTELARHYPNDVLISGFDILFFWDARMMMQGMHFMGEVPWRTLYLHGLVRAADGQKMSKSKGNTADPLELIDKYGADALRFFMAAMESQGRDIKMDEKRLEGYRNFATKLWNAARFCQSNGIGASTQIEPPEAALPVNRWIIAETIETVQKLDRAFADYRFDGAANAIYHFTWDRFCDWYLELIKPVLQGENSPLPFKGGDQGVGAERAAASVDEASDSTTPSPSSEEEGDSAAETRKVAGWVLDQILVMLHPFMPFVTEELWSKLGDRPDYPLITAQWPVADVAAAETASLQTNLVIEFIEEVRRVRADLNVPAGAKPQLSLSYSTVDGQASVTAFQAAIERLGRVELVSSDEQGSGTDRASAAVDTNHLRGVLDLEGIIDLGAEKSRLAKSLEAAEKEAASLDKRLSNPQFREKAKPEAVAKAEADHAEKTAEAERLRAALARLG